MNCPNLLEKLGLVRPLIVAPMAGGPSSPELVAVASMAGALGSVGAAYYSPAAIAEFVMKVRAKTNQPFAINLFIPGPISVVCSETMGKAILATRTYREELELVEPQLKAPFTEDFDAQFEEVLSIKPAVLSFVFGLLGVSYISEAKKAGIYLIGTATTIEEAFILEASGVDAIVLQGIEAGGHRGIFDPLSQDAEISTFELLHECVRKISLPLIAAGGIMTKDDVRRALAAGAQAVQMGTVFLACREAGTSASYVQELVRPGPRSTRTTRAFSGRLARGIQNRFMIEMDQHPAAILPYPQQNKFTRDIRSASIKLGNADFLSLWCGAGQGEISQESCVDIISKLFE